MALFDGIRADFRRFLAYAPGSRFVQFRDQRRRERNAPLDRIMLMGVGVFFLLAGIVMLFTPGPGLLAIGFALMCFASESIRIARFCDRLEMRIRALWARVRRR